jgi:hypothetical protein
MTSLLESFVKLPWFFVEKAMTAALNLEVERRIGDENCWGDWWECLEDCWQFMEICRGIVGNL